MAVVDDRGNGVRRGGARRCGGVQGFARQSSGSAQQTRSPQVAGEKPGSCASRLAYCGGGGVQKPPMHWACASQQSAAVTQASPFCEQGPG